MLKYSTSEENYIKTIFHLEGRTGIVTTNELAHQLATRPASVTSMMKKLKAKKLLHYRPYQGFRLSSEGKKVAVLIIRRHRLWEYFLAEKLKFNWDEVHEVAEHLEHVSSKKLIDKLDEYLDHPRVDPHGDPIPDKFGKINKGRQVCLCDLSLRKAAVVSHVGDQSPELLAMLRYRKISIGSRLEVRKRFSFDNSIEIKLRNRPAFVISSELAKQIFVQPY